MSESNTTGSPITDKNQGILLKDLKNEEQSVRLAFVRNLRKLAETITADRFREEVIPKLKDLLEDEDEILLALAEELGNEQNIDHFVGGAAHVHLLITPLETLLKFDENNVREKAVDSITNIVKRLPENNFEIFVELVIRLSDSEFYSSKSSACALIHVAYPRASKTCQSKLLTQFKKCCEDHTPIVRRNAASNLKKLVALVDGASLPLLVENFKILAADDQDSVRLLAIENCVAIGGKLTEEEKNTLVKPLVLVCGSDKSWRVRYMVANCFAQLVDALGKQITQNDLVPVFVKLLKDTEAEVRTAAASKVSGVCKQLVLETVVKDILPCVRSLSTDESAAVREALASDVMVLAPRFGREGTSEHLLDIFLQLLKDDSPEVRLNVIGKLNEAAVVFDIEQLSQHLLPALFELAEDRQWRIRQAVQGHIPQLAKQLGVNYFNERLCGMCISWLNDCVFSIREAATQNLKNITVVFGVPWAKQILLPHINQQAKHRNYLYRTVALSLVSALADIFPETDLQQDLIPVVFILAVDPIANIRINAVKTLTHLIPKLDKNFVQSTIIPFLNDKILQTQKDRDVIFFANITLQTANGKKN
jgi:serine/threonine-protein phosphatase 2A regulatory subunit A